MHELLLVVVGIAALAVIGLITIIITPQIMIEVGLWVLAAGLLIGLPTGFWYHVALYRELVGRGVLPPGWWLAPVGLHAHLTPQQFSHVKPWFVAGAVGFVLCCVGGIAAIAGLSILRFSS